MDKKEKNVVSINTRYPEDVRNFLRDEAAQEGRSFNAHIIWILRQHIKQRQKIDKKATKNSEG